VETPHCWYKDIFSTKYRSAQTVIISNLNKLRYIFAINIKYFDLRDQKGANRVYTIFDPEVTFNALRRIGENHLASVAVFRGGGKKEKEEKAVPSATKWVWCMLIHVVRNIWNPILLKQLRLETTWESFRRSSEIINQIDRTGFFIDFKNKYWWCFC